MIGHRATNTISDTIVEIRVDIDTFKLCWTN